MEVINPQGTPNRNQESTRIKYCRLDCGASVVETRKHGINGFSLWVQDQWADGGLCNNCKIIEDARIATENEEKQRLIKAKRKLEQSDRLAKMIGGDKPNTECTFDRFDSTLNMMAFNKAKNFNPLTDNLFFYGSTGIGKTHLAVALSKDQCEKGYEVFYFRVPDLMREFRRNLDPDDEEKLLRKLITAPVLVIDDLGAGKATEYVIEKLHEVIDGRQNDYRCGLVLTSNLSLNGIAETFKDRIADRLHGLCELIKLDGQSHRGKR